MTYHLQLKSANEKTGRIPVSTSTALTCADSCPLKGNGCYAEGYPLKGRWQEVTDGKRGVNWQEFVGAVAALPEGQLWRHNQAGDLPGNGDVIDAYAMGELVEANRGKRGFTYTHKPHDLGDNLAAVSQANMAGFTVNWSANNLAHADELAALNAGPVATVLPIAYERLSKGGEWLETLEHYRQRLAAMPQHTADGRRFVVCPATYRDDVNCASCGLCAVRGRKVIVGFPAHGNAKRKASNVAEAA